MASREDLKRYIKFVREDLLRNPNHKSISEKYLNRLEEEVLAEVTADPVSAPVGAGIPTPAIPTPAMPQLLKFPPGTPWWVYLIALMIPALLGGGAGFAGFSFTTATEVDDKLEEHIDDFDDLQYNILLLCEAQGIRCKGVDED